MLLRRLRLVPPASSRQDPATSNPELLHYNEYPVERQKTRLLFRNSGVAFVANCLNAVFLAYVNWVLGSTALEAFGWSLSVVTIAAGRYALARRFARAHGDDPSTMAWRYRYTAATALLGAAWGAGATVFMWNAPDGAQLFTGLVLCGMVAGAVPVLASVHTAFLTFTLFVFLPTLAVTFAKADSPVDWAFGTVSIVFIATVLASARFLNDTLNTAIHLGLEKARLLANLERVRHKAEAAVEASNLSLWDFDVSSGEIRLDDNWPRIAGGDPGERIVKSTRLLKIVHRDVRRRVVRATREFLAGQLDVLAQEVRIRTASGQWKWIMWRGKVIQRGPDGRPLRAVGTCVDITQRKNNDHALAESEQRFRNMFNRHNAVMLLVDAATGRIADANVAATRFYGFTREQLRERLIQDINVLPAEEVARERTNALEGKTNTFVFPHRLANGEVRTVEVHSTPITVNGGTLLFSIVHDITERQHFERELLKQSARNELFLRRASDGIHIVDAAGTIIEASESLCAMLGYTKAELLAMNLAQIEVRSPIEASLHAIAAQLIDLGSVATFETQYRHRDGRLLDIEVSTAGIELEGERLLYISARDVTGRKHQLHALTQAASVFAHAHDGIIICDAARRIVDVNPAFTRVTGYSKDEVVGRNPKFLSSGRYDAAFFRSMRERLRREGCWEGEIWNRRKSGELYVERLYIAVIRDPASTLIHYIGVFSDITEVRLQHEQLKLLAHHDALTGLPNRALLADRMGAAIASAQRSSKLMAVCYLDVDGFKGINDTLGHEAGDRLLIEMSQRLKHAVRGADTVARLGGDEFALLLVELDSIEHGQRALARLMEAVTMPFTLDGRVVSVTASIGVTIVPDDSGDPDRLLRHADQAMYLAKQSGKNCFKLFNPEHDRIARAHRESLERIRRGIRDGEFTLHYQPKVNMRDGSIVGFEALARWQHPEQGIRLPANFLPILDGTDGELELGRWVLDAALRQLAAWTEARQPYELSVNISAAYLLHPQFISDVHELLETYSWVAASRLELEILETAALKDVSRAIETIHRCHSMGIRVALDDFGTGHSSLSYVRLLPIDTVKIDRIFIRNIPIDPENVALVRCILGLTHAFARRVIAEGVESRSEATALVAMGCDIGQGFGIARPIPADQVSEWAMRWQRAPFRCEELDGTMVDGLVAVE